MKYFSIKQFEMPLKRSEFSACQPIALNLRSLKKVFREGKSRQTLFEVEIKLVHDSFPSF